ncbi:hypothetical protein LINPERHAP1_LOCUS37613 [Linum perenne]
MSPGSDPGCWCMGWDPTRLRDLSAMTGQINQNQHGDDVLHSLTVSFQLVGENKPTLIWLQQLWLHSSLFQTNNPCNELGLLTFVGDFECLVFLG